MKIDILITTYNDEKYIGKCIENILNQSHKDFNLIIVDDGSNDNSPNIIRSFSDKRIEYHRFEENSKNIARIRNIAFNFLKNEWCFITDGDCYADKNWLKNGIDFIKRNKDIVGMEGKVIYGYVSYKKTLSDRYIQNLAGGAYSMANAAYKRELLVKYQLNEEGNRMQDRSLALALIRDGYKINFNEKSIIYHAIKKDSIKWIFTSAKNAVPKVIMYKEYADKAHIKNYIYSPKNLLKIVFPPVLLYSLIVKVRTKRDLLKWLLYWPFLCVERYWVWKTAIKKRIFVI